MYMRICICVYIYIYIYMRCWNLLLDRVGDSNGGNTVFACYYLSYWREMGATCLVKAAPWCMRVSDQLRRGPCLCLLK